MSSNTSTKQEKIEPFTYENWRIEAAKRYPNGNIIFRCPVCGWSQSISSLKAAGAPIGTWGFSCIGRYLDKCQRAFGSGINPKKNTVGPCDYAGGGLIGLNPVPVLFDDGSVHYFFDFAHEPLVKK